MTKSRVGYLELLRFLAAAIVLVAHLYDNHQHPIGFHIFDFKKNFAIAHTGVAGVIIFFLISGYIIPFSLNTSNSIKEFLLKRIIRIYPLLSIVALYGMLRFSEDFKERMLTGFLLPVADFIKSASIVKGVDWTLRLEFIFYIIIALLFFRKKLTLKNIFIAILICSALAVLTYYLNNTYYNYRLIFINFMFCGALLFFLQNENFKNKKHIFLTVVAFITSILIFQIRIESTYLFPGMIFGVLLFISLFMLNETKYAIKSNKVLMTAGAISYPCYLLHMMIFEDIYNFTHSHIATITIFIVVCYLLTNYIETPIINKLKNKFLTKAD